MILLSISTILNAQSIPSYVPASGLVGWWPFAGNGNDISGNGNNATATGAVLTADRFGNSNNAYNFTNGYLSSTTTLNIPRNTAMSISVWFNEATNFNIGEFICLGSSSNTTWGAVGGNNAFTVNYGRGCGSTGSSLQQITLGYNQWHHVVFVSNGLGGHSDIYYDGVFFGTSTNANSGGCSSTKLYFGIDIYSNIKYNGKLDDIGIWNRALSPCEVKQLFQGTGITTQPVNQSVSITNSAKFIAASSYPGSTFQWQTDTGSGFQNITNNAQYNGATNDTLTVLNTTLSNNNQLFRCAITSGSCTVLTNSATLTVINDVGINELSNEHLFSIFPNPASNQISLKADERFIGNSYIIYDYTGKMVLTGTIKKEITLINLENLSIGMYAINIGLNSKCTVKLIKE